jgi:hypothetical protein
MAEGSDHNIDEPDAWNRAIKFEAEATKKAQLWLGRRCIHT